MTRSHSFLAGPPTSGRSPNECLAWCGPRAIWIGAVSRRELAATSPPTRPRVVVALAADPWATHSSYFPRPIPAAVPIATWSRDPCLWNTHALLTRRGGSSMRTYSTGTALARVLGKSARLRAAGAPTYLATGNPYGAQRARVRHLPVVRVASVRARPPLCERPAARSRVLCSPSA